LIDRVDRKSAKSCRSKNHRQVDRVASIFSLIKSIDLLTTNRVKNLRKLAYLCAKSVKWPDGRNDGHTSMSVISAICRSGYFQQPTQPRRLCTLSLHVDCRLDYCNSLLHGTDSLFRRLQSAAAAAQNAAACLITGITATGSHYSGVEGPPLAAGSASCLSTVS